VDDDLVNVTDDQQWRILQRLAILEQLLVSLVQIAMLALVLPGEIALLLHIGKAIAANGLVGPNLKSEPFPSGVGFYGSGMVNEMAEVNEVAWGCGSLFLRGSAPSGNKFLGGYGWRHVSICLGWVGNGFQ